MFAGKLEKLFNDTLAAAMGKEKSNPPKPRKDATDALVKASQDELKLNQEAYESLLQKSLATNASLQEAIIYNERCKGIDKKLMLTLAANDELVKINRELVNRVETMKRDLNAQIKFMQNFQTFMDNMSGTVRNLPDRMESHDKGWLGETKLTPQSTVNFIVDDE